MRIILASQSLFRRKALEILGLTYETKPSSIDEKSIRHANPEKLAQLLSEAKARDVGSKEGAALVISGDLFVVFKKKIYEKPSSSEEAFAMLKSFSGNKLDIVAGVAVYNSKINTMRSTTEKYTVKFRMLEDHEIRDYISRYPVQTFSAAFEGDGLVRFAESTEGPYPFLTAFPMNPLIRFLRENGLKV